MSPFRRRTTVLGLTAALTVGLTACGASAPDPVAAPGTQMASSCGTIRIADNPWVGYTADLAVVSYLLTHELGCKVETKAESQLDSIEDMHKGNLDVNLEMWGHEDLRKKYIDIEKNLVEAGQTGNTGVVGWYIPEWMAKEYPNITDWKHLNEYAHLFQTPDSGNAGAFMLSDKSYETNDAVLIKNLGLNFKVYWSGSEDNSIAAFQKAQKDHTALIGYFYEPQWVFTPSPLARISLPPYTPGCDANKDTVRCDYQPYDLDKVTTKKFADSGSPAFDLIKKFNWKNEDQNSVAYDLAVNKLSRDDAAKKWLDAHPDVWKTWLPNPA
jgi:glycine betaine/proline transport system substrate-binding protein